MRRRWPLLLLAAAALQSTAPARAIVAPTEQVARSSAWWRAYDDPLLHELLSRAPARSGLLLRAYVELRVAALQADIAGQLQAVAAQRLARVQQRSVAGGSADAALQPALQQARQLEQLHHAADAEAEHRLELLAALSAVDAETLRGRIVAAALLPQVSAAPPAADPRPLRQDDPAGLQRERSRQVLVQAAERARRSHALLQAAQLQREAVRVRLGEQAAGDDALADAQMHWLMQAAQVAGDDGQLALAWSQWLQAGGAAPVAAATLR